MHTKSFAPLFALAIFAALSAAPAASAHDVVGGHPGEAVTATPLPMVVEKTGPFHSPKVVQFPAGSPISGSGYWKFVPARELTPVPPAALPKLKGAHGTIIVDQERDQVFWGLEGVGWIGFSNHLTASWIVACDPTFAHGNLHGADILPRKGQLPLV
ncbi:MAG TPA: hypothetical protein VMB21_13575, partial [Candidatus Limnocylindria bacterium]|nr:hypothetical protein [Candidatus Limnocylindria bacterium]